MKISGQVDARTPEGRQKALEMMRGNDSSLRKGKFNNVPVENENGSFDSKREASWAGRLIELQEQGCIKNLKLDKDELKYPLKWNSVLICVYEADAEFEVVEGLWIPTRTGPKIIREGEKHIFDAKGVLTPAYRLKKKMMLAAYGIKIIEV